MFEKEAREYATRDVFFDGVPEPVINHRRKDDWQKGAEYGFKRCKEISNKIIQSLLTIIYTESRTDIYVDEIGDAEKFLEEDNV